MTSFRFGPDGGGDDPLRVGDRFGDRLLEEHVRARLHRLDRVLGVGVRHGVDRDDVRLQRAQRVVERGEPAGAGERLGHGARADPAGAQAGDLEAVDARVGERVAHAHVAEADDENAFVIGHPVRGPTSG